MIGLSFKQSHKTIRRVLASVCALFYIFSLFSFSAFASEDPAPTVRVGYYENEVFEEGAAEGVVKTGYAYEYYRKLSEYTGWKYEYVYGSFSDLYQQLIDGEIDLLAGLAWTEDRVGMISYPDEPMGRESYNLVKHDHDVETTVDPASMNGKTFGVLNSAMEGALREYLDSHRVKAKVVTFDDYEELFTAFDNEEVEILAAEGDGAYGRSHAEVLTSFGSSDYYLCVSKTQPELLSELNTAQSLLVAEEPNYLNSLRAKYYPFSVSARAFSPAEKQWLDTHHALRIGYFDDYLPFCGTNDQGEPTGIVKDIVPEILRGLGIKDLYISYYAYDTYDEMIADVSSGRLDAAFPIGGGLYYAEESGIYQTSPLMNVSIDLVFKGEYDEDTMRDFAVNKCNGMQYYYATTYFPDSKITMYPSAEACLEAVLSGRASCTTLNGLRSSEILKNSRFKGLSSQQLLSNDIFSFGVKIGNEGLLKLLNRGINVVGPDFAQNLAFRYTQGLYRYTFFDLLRDYYILFLFIILAVSALVIFILIKSGKKKKKDVLAKEAARKELENRNRELSESREALSNALAAAEQASKAKTAFLNNMSHDIRTPMNAIIGFTALAASHIDNKAQVQDYLEKITVSSHHLLSLINDVLDMSRIESGKVTIDEAEVHLPDVVRDLRTIIQPNIEAKKMELFIDTQDVLHEDVIADRMRLNQVLLNILSNAIKFTPEGGTISFRVVEKPTTLPDYAGFEFHIKDNGIGMSEEFQKTLFDPFTRENTSTVSGIQGTGLGMAITKNIVDMMGGTITVRSEKEKGSEFIVELPCKISEKSAKAEPIPELQGMRALVADDDVNTCLSVCAMLHEIGMRSDWTSYGKEAVIRAREAYERADEFSVYIIDWMMPDQNGIETVRQIRKIIGDSTPIIILTAYDYADIEDEARQAGVTAFCSKPLFMSELRRILSLPFADRSESSDYRSEQKDFVGKRILLAEDNEMNQMIAIAVLEDHGFEVETAVDGIEAVEKVKAAPAGHFDIILMDIQMPRMNGYDASKAIRALEDQQKAQIPIVAVTANAFEEDRVHAIEAGMNGYLAKPYDVPSILKTLNDLI